MYYGILRADKTIRALYERQGVIVLKEGETEVSIMSPLVDLTVAHHTYDSESDTIVRKSNADIAAEIERSTTEARELATREGNIANMTRLLALRALKDELSVTDYDDEINQLEETLGVK